MDSIGAEVGQKMRSAIKAKLMELDCYVDEELPDYIMVMVANRRTKSQMNDDLTLFLSTKTSTFVNWLHIVLKKLKEVTVTNPEVYKKAIKRKSSDSGSLNDESSLKLKKEKSHKKFKKEEQLDEENDSTTEELPMKISKNRKIIIADSLHKDGDNFDIPLLSEVTNSNNEEELKTIEKKIRSVKSRLGLLVESDDEHETKVEDGNQVNFPKRGTSTEEISEIKEVDSPLAKNREVELEDPISDHERTPPIEKKSIHKRITYESDTEASPVKSRLNYFNSRDISRKRPSVLDRLGRRMESPEKSRRSTENRHNSRRSSSRDRFNNRLSDRLGRSTRQRDDSRDRKRSISRDRSPLKVKERNKERDSKKEGILSRLGVQSKVEVIKKPVSSREKSDDEKEEVVIREVQSSIKVKPRVIPSKAMANKNLLLKAVADAQRSVAQTPSVGKDVKAEGFFTKKYSGKQDNALEKNDAPKRSGEHGKNRLKEIIKQSSSRMRSWSQQSSDDDYDSDGEYIPKPMQKQESKLPSYTPSSKEIVNDASNIKEKDKQQFIITLDGIENLGLKKNEPSAKSRTGEPVKKRPGSPVILINPNTNNGIVESKPSRSNIPDKLPIVHPPLSVKHKERCKYWPACRQKDKCEFVHPSQPCQTFPQCKFGDKCLFLHPSCKFSASCTKRDCPYDHSSASMPATAVPVQNCKYFPNCTNGTCPFYHPKLCKYGKYCKNIAECSFSHEVALPSKNLTWKSK